MLARWQAREAYEKGLELEPDERTLQQAAHAAHIAESKAAEARSHKFKRREGRPAAGAAGRGGNNGRPPPPKRQRPQAAAGVQNTAMLSFGDDEEEEV